MKNVYQQREENNAAANEQWFAEMQAKPYEWKVRHAEEVAKSYYEKVTQEYHGLPYLSVGGLDSQVLHYFFEEIGLPVTCVSCSSLEDKSIQDAHRRIADEMERTYDAAEWYHGRGVLTPREVEALANDEEDYSREQALLAECLPPPRFIFLHPLKSKVEVLQEYGWPILSKEKAQKISRLQHPTAKNATVRHAIITGETGAYECCYYLKEKPCNDWAKKHKGYPYMGLMASEGGRREKCLKAHLCNYFGKTVRSAPFAIFSRQDLLRLALDLRVPVPEVYGVIERLPDGSLYTTKAQRTGCTMCGFGIHLEQRPHRFDRLLAKNPKEWEFWMFRCCTDESGEKYGWGRVLDYCGIPWRQEATP